MNVFAIKKKKKYKCSSSSRTKVGTVKDFFLLKIFVNFSQSLNVSGYQWEYFNWLPFI